jgi:hypothetical protein
MCWPVKLKRKRKKSMVKLQNTHIFVGFQFFFSFWYGVCTLIKNLLVSHFEASKTAEIISVRPKPCFSAETET